MSTGLQSNSIGEAAPLVEPLFRPLRIRGLELRNRVVMAPMTREFFARWGTWRRCPGLLPAPAEADTALLITEGVGIDHPAALGEAGLGEADIPAPVR